MLSGIGRDETGGHDGHDDDPESHRELLTDQKTLEPRECNTDTTGHHECRCRRSRSAAFADFAHLRYAVDV